MAPSRNRARSFGQERLGFPQIAEPFHRRAVRVHQRAHLPRAKRAPPPEKSRASGEGDEGGTGWWSAPAARMPCSRLCTITTMNSLLTRGLRNARLRGSGDWRELVTKAIKGEWPDPAASPQTLEAEGGLGILGKPYYFYVLRAEDSYGLVVFVLSEAEGVVWPADERGSVNR